jgi:hypothetical protein
MVKIAKEAGQKCILNKPLYCPKNGEHLTEKWPVPQAISKYLHFNDIERLN